MYNVQDVPEDWAHWFVIDDGRTVKEVLHREPEQASFSTIRYQQATIDFEQSFKRKGSNHRIKTFFPTATRNKESIAETLQHSFDSSPKTKDLLLAVGLLKPEIKAKRASGKLTRITTRFRRRFTSN